MKRTIIRRLGLTLSAAIGGAGLAILPVSAMATARSAAASSASGDQAKVSLIIKRGDSEIARRISSLQALSSKINNATKLTASDKATLNSEVTSEINNLNSLKAKLDADTTVADAKADAQSIISSYRVYVLIVPKVNLVKTADSQQVAEAKLSALISKFQTRINAAKSQGKNVTALQNALTNMQTNVSNAQTISGGIESDVIALQPSDYNSDHSLLNGKRDKLITAQNDVKAAVSDATTIVSGLKNL